MALNGEHIILSHWSVRVFNHRLEYSQICYDIHQTYFVICLYIYWNYKIYVLITCKTTKNIVVETDTWISGQFDPGGHIGH